MKITFVIPPLNLSGGGRVIAIYAELLEQRGHTVTVVAPPDSSRHSWRRLLPSKWGATVTSREPSHFDGSSITVNVIPTARAVIESDVPAADCIIATWWETAEWVNGFSLSAGVKVYFVQHHEVFPFLPQQRTRATYRMPFRKIVVARWLADVMRYDYGDTDVDLVPNAVDRQKFYALPRGKQVRPTVGLLYSSTEWKRFWPVLECLKSLRKLVPELHVQVFGSEYPASPLPGFVSFSHRPPQDALRGIYASCDVWLTASSTEGFNLPAMEAMACRTPVVATRTGWPAETVISGLNGACVDVNDMQSFERETARILSLSDADWRMLSAGAFDTVRESSWNRSTDLFEQALAREVKRGRVI